MHGLFLVITMLLMVSNSVYASYVHLGWEKKYNHFSSISIAEIEDGQLRVAGREIFNKEAYVLWGLDSVGNELARQQYKSKGEIEINRLIVADNGFLVLGTHYAKGMYSLFIDRFDGKGKLVWEKQIGRNTYLNAKVLFMTPDDCCIFAGTGGSGADLSAWVVKLDKQGQILWEKYYDKGIGVENVVGGIPTNDGGCILTVNQYHGDKFGNGRGSVWLMRLSRDGKVVQDRELKKRTVLTEGGKYVAGYENGFVLASHSWYITPFLDIFLSLNDSFILRYDYNFNQLWKQKVKHRFSNATPLVALSEDGNCFVAAVDQDVIWIEKIDESGNAVWSDSYTISKDAEVEFQSFELSDFIYDKGQIYLSGKGNEVLRGNGFREAAFVISIKIEDSVTSLKKH